MAKTATATDPRLRAVEAAVTDTLDQDPVDQILATVNRIVDQAHRVALGQCSKARETIERACREAINTIDLVESTINAKRTGTSEQFAHYMAAVRTATLSADEVNASTLHAITSVRDAIGKVAEQVMRLPTPTAAAPSDPPALEKELREVGG